MKKLFVLFLLVALVPFTVGCSLWGQDEDRDVLDSAKVEISAKVPASIVSASGALRAAVGYSTLTMTIDGITLNAVSISALDADGKYTIVFNSGLLTLAQRAFLTDGTADTCTIVSTVGGVATDVLSFSLNLTSTTAVAFTVASDGTVSMVSGGTTTGTPTLGAIPSLKVTSVTLGGTALTASATTAVPTNSVTPVFAVNFDNAISTLTGVAWKVDVTHVSATGATVKAYSLDSTVTADAGLFTVNNDAASATVNVTLVAAAAPKNLEPGNIYKVKLTASALKSTAGAYMTVTNDEYFFKVQ